MTLVLADDDGCRILQPGTEADGLTVALATEDAVVHRIVLNDVSERGRMDEARMRATDLSAQPVDDMLLALGPVLPDGSAWLAIIAQERLASRLEQLRAQGVVPQRMVPAVLLLPEPEGEAPSVAAHGGLQMLRTRDLGAMIEPGLVAMLAAGAGPDRAPLLADALLPELADSAPNFLTGRFAPTLQWWREPWFRWTVGLLLALAILLAAAPDILARQQIAATVAGHDAETVAIAERALGTEFADAEVASAALSAARRRREAGMTSARITALGAGMANVPGARLAALRSDAAGHLALTLAGSADAVNRLRSTLETGAFEAGGQGIELTLGARRGASAVSPDPAAIALARRYDATMDAMILAALPQRPDNPPGIVAALARAGLEPDPDSSNATQTALPAVRATVLLPLLAEAEASGVRFASMEIMANPDATVRTLLETAP